jgi:hypothetical protein
MGAFKGDDGIEASLRREVFEELVLEIESSD